MGKYFATFDTKVHRRQGNCSLVCNQNFKQWQNKFARKIYDVCYILQN